MCYSVHSWRAVVWMVYIYKYRCVVKQVERAREITCECKWLSSVVLLGFSIGASSALARFLNQRKSTTRASSSPSSANSCTAKASQASWFPMRKSFAASWLGISGCFKSTASIISKRSCLGSESVKVLVTRQKWGWWQFAVDKLRK